MVPGDAMPAGKLDHEKIEAEEIARIKALAAPVNAKAHSRPRCQCAPSVRIMCPLDGVGGHGEPASFGPPYHRQSPSG